MPLKELPHVCFTGFQKLFEVPAYTEAQKRIPYARVNHNKYMVTDNAAYIGETSSFSMLIKLAWAYSK